MEITAGKLIALGIGIAEMAVVAAVGGRRDFIVEAESAVGVGLVLIWFAEQLGSATGFIGHGEATSETPGWMVAGFGWCVMVTAPVVLWWIWRG